MRYRYLYLVPLLLLLFAMALPAISQCADSEFSTDESSVVAPAEPTIEPQTALPFPIPPKQEVKNLWSITLGDTYNPRTQTHGFFTTLCYKDTWSFGGNSLATDKPYVSVAYTDHKMNKPDGRKLNYLYEVDFLLDTAEQDAGVTFSPAVDYFIPFGKKAGVRSLGTYEILVQVSIPMEQDIRSLLRNQASYKVGSYLGKDIRAGLRFDTTFNSGLAYSGGPTLSVPVTKYSAISTKVIFNKSGESVNLAYKLEF